MFTSLLKKKLNERKREILQGQVEVNNDTVLKTLNSLLPHIAARTNCTVDNIKKHFGEVKIEKELIIDAYGEKKKNSETFEIRIFNGILIFLDKMIELLVALVSIGDDEGEIIEKSTKDPNEIYKKIGKLLDAYKDYKESKDDDSFRLFNIRTSFIFELNKRQGLLWATMCYYSETFIIAHECSHIILKLYKKRIEEEISKAQLYAEKECTQFLKENSYTKSKINEILNNWITEMTADLFGLKLCLDLEKNNHKLRLIVFSSIEWVLSIFNMCEKYIETNKKAQISETHPPAHFRLDFLRGIIRNAMKTKTELLGLGCKELSNGILSSIFNSKIL